MDPCSSSTKHVGPESVPQQAKGHRDTNKRECHWSWDPFTALLDEEGVELEIKTLTVQ